MVTLNGITGVCILAAEAVSLTGSTITLGILTAGIIILPKEAVNLTAATLSETLTTGTWILEAEAVSVISIYSVISGSWVWIKGGCILDKEAVSVIVGTTREYIRDGGFITALEAVNLTGIPTTIGFLGATILAEEAVGLVGRATILDLLGALILACDAVATEAITISHICRDGAIWVACQVGMIDMISLTDIYPKTVCDVIMFTIPVVPF